MSAPPSTPRLPPSAVVIGAGLAGLSAAVRLRAAGLDVRVYDPAPAGGKARTLEPQPGWRVEWGPHSFLHRADALWTLAAELGIAEQAMKLGAAAKARYLVRGGRLRKAPLGAFTVSEWAGVLRGMFRRVPDVPGESVYDWFARRFGTAFARGPLDAMITGIWACDPAAVEMEAAFPTVARLVRERGTVFGALRAARADAAAREPGAGARPTGTYGFPLGMGALADAAVDRLGPGAFVHARVDGLTRVGARYHLDTAAGPVEADAVVLAVEAPAAARLLARIAPGAVEPLGAVRYAPLAVAHWLSPDAALPHGFGFLAAHAEDRPTLGTIFVSDLYPDRVPPGTRSFATMFGGARRPGDAEIDAQEARRRIEAEHRALTGRSVTLGGLHLVRHAAAVAPPAPGHAARIAAVRAAVPPGLAVAGAWCGAGAMDDAVRAGFDAASVITRAAEAADVG